MALPTSLLIRLSLLLFSEFLFQLPLLKVLYVRELSYILCLDEICKTEKPVNLIIYRL